MWTRIVNGWHFMRWLRLVTGLILAYQAYVLADSVFGFMAVFFLLQAITDTGCCGASSCATASYRKPNENPDEPEFEMINHKTK